MDKMMEKSFDVLEAALSQLIETVSSYNPSPMAATAVVAADDEISKSLELLAEHQANYHKIQSLRTMSEVLNQRLTQLLSTLAQTRKELLAVPSTTFPPSRDIPYEELLTYARKISKYTQPPSSHSFNPPATLATGNSNVPPQADEARPNIGLTNEEIAALDPSSRVVFTPWPSEEVMRRGALAQITLAGEGIITNKPLEQPQNGANGGGDIVMEDEGAGVSMLNGIGEGQSQAWENFPPRDMEKEKKEREQQHSAAFIGLDLNPDLE